MIDPKVFVIARIVLFFVATIFIFKTLQAIDLSKVFKANSGDQIRFLYMVFSVILGYLLTDALVSLFENLNSLL